VSIRNWSFGVAATVLIVGLAACGSDDDSSTTGDADTSSSVAETTATPTTGSASTALTTPPDDGAFAPQPLAEPRSIKVSAPAKLEIYTAALLAEQLGEFENENLDVEFVILPSSDALPQLAQGNLDICICSHTPGIFNALDTGIDVAAVGPLFDTLPDGTGVYVTPDLTGCSPGCLKGKKLASSAGLAVAGTALNFDTYLSTGGLTLDDVEYVDLQPADVLVAMEQGGADGGYVISPFYQVLVESGSGVLVHDDTNGNFGVGYFVGAMRQDDPEVVQAFLRAVARTTNTYLQPGYKQNEEVVAALAAALELEPTLIAEGPETVFDASLEMDWDELTQRVQEIWIAEGIVEYDAPIPTDRTVDASFVEALGG
jgi:ABC-type nitrate/sulfonate/bicarbonate transport system substrate-binding protein